MRISAVSRLFNDWQIAVECGGYDVDWRITPGYTGDITLHVDDSARVVSVREAPTTEAGVFTAPPLDPPFIPEHQATPADTAPTARVQSATA